MTIKSELNEVVRTIKSQVKVIIEDNNDEQQPIMFVFTPERTIIAAMELTDETKAVYRPMMTALLRKLNAFAYISINEGWTYTAHDIHSQEAREVLSGKVQVRDLPPHDRQEIVMITVIENKKSSEVHQAKIIHTKDDRRVIGEWLKRDEIGEGRMIVKEW